MQNVKKYLKKIPKPETSKYKSWESFVKAVHKSIGKRLGCGTITLKNMTNQEKNIKSDNSSFVYTSPVRFFTLDDKIYTIDEFVQYFKQLYTENKKNKAQLDSIEQDGTEEHNAAVKLRQENATLNIKIDELNKEILGLRHLKEENVMLMEKITDLLEKHNSMDAQSGQKYMQAKLQIVQNNYKKCSKERDEFKHQLNAANKDNQSLRLQIIALHKIIEGGKNTINEQKKEINKLKQGYSWEQAASDLALRVVKLEQQVKKLIYEK